jgi:uncharacterized protein YjdB
VLRFLKRRATSLLPLVVASLTSVFALACGSSTEPIYQITRTTVATVETRLDASTLAIGQSSQATAVAKSPDGAVLAGKTVSWSSLNPSVATVSPSGLVTAIAPGTATIRADIDERTGDAGLTVAAPTVATVSVSFAAAPITVGQTTQATALLQDANGNTLSDRAVTWSSSDSTVATVSPSGLVTAVAAGSVTIHASVEGVDGSAGLSVGAADLPVTTVPVATVSVLVASRLTVGQTVQATAVAKDVNGNVLTGRPVVWASLDSSVATVSSTGVVTPVSGGQAVIQATVEGQVGGTVVIVSGPAVAVVSVQLAASSLTAGQTTQAMAVARDANGNVLTGRSVTWSSLNTSVATVSSLGVVTAKAAGQVDISATVDGVVGSAALTVSAPVATVATVSVILGTGSLAPGQTTQATAVAKDANGNVLTGRPVIWTSLNSAVATVSATGLVTALASGSATIRATVDTKIGDAAVAVAAVATAPTSPAAVVLPELPRSYVDTRPSAMPSPGTVRHVKAGDDLQAVINAAVPGDRIELDPGATFVGNYVLPAKSGASAAKWITITTSGVSLTEGTRITPATARSLNLARLRSATYDAALQAVNGASYYRITGLELDVASSVTLIYTILDFSAGSQHDIADHLYIHGSSTSPIVRGVALNGAALGVTDSYIADIHGNNFDSQAIVGWAGPGPYKIVNNYLEAAGENIMFGGSDPTVSGQLPSDIEIRGNHVFKPLTWGMTWTVKNLLELKDAQRVLVEGNVFENCWAGGQTGYAIVMQAVSQQDTAPWSTVADITFRYNYVTNATGGAAINSRTSGQLGKLPTNPSQRILLENNIFDRIGVDPVLGTAAGNGNMIMLLNDLRNVTIRHNSLIGASLLNAGMMLGGAGLGPEVALVVRDNVYDLGQYGIAGSGTGVGTAAFKTYAPDADLQGNVFFAHPNYPFGSWGSPSNYPTNNSFVNSSSDVGFTSFSSGGYSLSGASLFRSKGTDGLDPGANIAVFNTKIAGAR